VASTYRPQDRNTHRLPERSTDGLQERIAGMMLGGAPLDRVEEEVIEPCELSTAHKAGLWLFAWSYLGSSDQRARANAYLASLR
jgi:hypothetical protein